MKFSYNKYSIRSKNLRTYRKIILMLAVIFPLQLMAQSVSNLTAQFTNCKAVVNFTLTSGSAIDLTLMYTGDGGKTWLPCTTVSGDITGQTTGSKQIVWDCYADGIRWGMVEFRIDLPKVQVACVRINGVCWATRNLDVGGKFVTNPEDYGALYQWGRPADGHESRTSTSTTTLATTDTPGHDKFIITFSSPYDWRNHQNDKLWNAGTEAAPIKAVNDPSPAGYRVPTATEIGKLLDNVKVSRQETTLNGVNGYRFTDKASGNSIFFPSLGGWRLFGALKGVDEYGLYWSSTVYGTDAYEMEFDQDFFDIVIGTGSNYRCLGLSVRPVAE